MADSTITASAPARIDLAGGTLDLWPLHVLHPGSFTVNVAIDRRATCRVRRAENAFSLISREGGFRFDAHRPAEFLREPRAALVGSLLEALEVEEPVEIEFSSGVPYGSGLGGSSALTVALMGALKRLSPMDFSRLDPVDFVRDVETRVLAKPAGVQDYYPPFEGGGHIITFRPGRTTAERIGLDAQRWEKHLTLFDSGKAHSSGMNNWEILRARLEGDAAVSAGLEEIRKAAVDMARAMRESDFEGMGRALAQEWAARRSLAPVVSTPTIERAVAAASSAGAWGAKACGAGGGGCVVVLSPEERTSQVRRALETIGLGAVLAVCVAEDGLRVSS